MAICQTNAQVNIRVVVGNNVSHPTHFAKRQLGGDAPGFFLQVGGRFTDDFDPSDDGILLLRIGPEIGFGGIADLARDEAGRFQNIAQPAGLFSVHTRTPRWTKYVRARSD